MVRRLILHPNGATFTAHRSPAGEGEFLASTDNWSRPVQTRTGPDGALYVVDMYRFVIEHPRWITPQRLATLDTRAGHDKGRIYRILPQGAQGRPIEDLSPLSTEQLAAKLDNPNGVVRDLIHRELVHRQEQAAVPALERIATQSRRPASRVQAICALDGLNSLKFEVLSFQITDPDPRVRRNALRVAEPRLASDPALLTAALKLTSDSDVAVRYQLALSLGQSDDERASAAPRIGAIIDLARRLAATPAIPLPQRVTAVALLCRDSAAAEADLRLLGDLLSPANPPALQSAALAALARGKVPGAAGVLVVALPRISPALRAVALDTLTARPESAELLLAAIEE